MTTTTAPIRHTFPTHPYVQAVSALPEQAPGADRPQLEGFAELGHLPTDPTTGRIPYLSPSQIKAITRCGLQYYYRYGLNIGEVVTSKMFFGTCTHAAMEVYLARKRAAGANPFNAEQAAREAHAMARYLATRRRPNPLQWEPRWYKGLMEDEESFLTSLAIAVDQLIPIWNTYEPVAIEQGFFIEWQDRDVLPVLAYADCIVREPDRNLTVLDCKTGREKKPISLETDIALAVEALAASLWYGQPVTAVGYLNYVRLKEPKVVSLRMPLDERLLERAYLRAKIVTAIARNGVFGPADDDATCAGCSYQRMCRDWLQLNPGNPNDSKPQSSVVSEHGPIAMNALLEAAS